ncbi:hypothetical protein B4U80_14738 [Leptotrombidium deliense]|uniref:Uncharacterized protein n=1 Tax=Leptotrombidium deliense TaxID=299467 RepID=A0A443QV46_9ACAR|nr:hypothetical protein B4U80_14738 [Leptotrombidium deliense]
MADMKLIQTFYDYFILGIELYREISADKWFEDLNMHVTKKEIIDRIKSYNKGTSKKVIISCQHDMFHSIRVCFSKDTLEWISCSDTEIPEVGTAHTDVRSCGEEIQL